MASVVYEGVAGGGDLFQGQKFFIAQRVPARTELIKNVEVNMPLPGIVAATNITKRNGGFVVPIEKNADVLIADHAKPKFAPANSISWTYLEQSMKKGQLEDLETHRISSPSRTGRPGGPSKSTRTPFTHEESMAISIWVAKAELMGLPPRGNEIYEQFAEKNPRHTPQSWRDHWIKQHSDRPRPEIDMNSTDWPVKKKGDRLRRAIPPAPQSKNVTTTPNASGARKHPVLRSPSLPTTPYSPEEELPFTEEDNEILEKEYPDIIDVPPEDWVRAWEAFAKKYGRHTAGDWCHHYLTVFKPQKCQETEDKDARAVKPKPNRGQDSTSKTYTTPVRAAVSSRSSTESRDTARHRKLGEDGTITSKSPESKTSKDQPQISASVDKAKFLEDLRELSSAIKREIEPSFSLYGRKLELYDLWSVVNKPEFGGFQKVGETNRWLQVSIKLGINTYRHETAHMDLKREYRDTLVNLDTFISLRDNGETKGRTSPEKFGEPATPVTAIPTRAAEQAHAYSSARKDGNTKRRVSLTKSTEPVTPVTAIPTQTPEQSHILSSGVSTPKTLRPATVLPRESANKDAAAGRIRQSLGHGQLAFLQSLSEFARDVLDDSVTFEPIVSKRKISLFDVWTASLPLLGHFDDIEGREVWDDLATKLGFEVSAHPSAPGELRQICEDFLLDFYEYFVQREQEKLKEEALRQQFEDHGQSEEEAVEDSDDNLEPPSLAFRTAGPGRQKRPHGQDSISAVVESRPTSSHSHNKRPRISKGKERADEIPSTPEHIYNSHLHSDGKLPDHPNAQNNKLMGTNIEYFPPPSSLEELDSSPTRQLRSEAEKGYTPPSRNNNEEEATQSQTGSHEEIKEFIERFGAEGFDIEIIKQMLITTTMEVEPAERLLSDYAEGLEISKNVAGVWTEEDDNGVKSHVQSSGYKRTLKKHGETRCLKRKDFLRDLEKCQEDSEEMQAEDA
ncbi:hypothetical protein V502_11151 [Pseudogymnoascus sp. VKM F-4520 (FW-2644)]|nr:hypothetical protein V502_11151 [Pseudogymnoascus sp. VKM F-4520 (FW-2644)]